MSSMAKGKPRLDSVSSVSVFDRGGDPSGDPSIDTRNNLRNILPLVHVPAVYDAHAHPEQTNLDLGGQGYRL